MFAADFLLLGAGDATTQATARANTHANFNMIGVVAVVTIANSDCVLLA